MISTFRIGFGRAVLTVTLLGSVYLAGAARADELSTVAVTIRDQHFSPSDIHVAAGKAVIVAISNDDSTAEEFDSGALKVEKMIAPGATARVLLRSLGPGKYPFMSEYDSD